ncbi:MAG TPA: C4-type zinc ribbon domain-containing protein [Kofleriaceae bacterium]|nr:C4-type zinc ribbon domain-containing protein [Kofleriaceae bacterium]
MDVKDQLLALLDIQKIDVRVNEVRASMKALPEKLAPAKRDLAKLEAMLAEEKKQLDDAEKFRREQEEFIKGEEDALKKAKFKVQAAKNTKDFAAASREVDNKRRSINEREEEVLKIIEALDKTRAQVTAHEADVERLRAQVTEEEQKISAQMTALTAEAAEHAAGRPQLAARIEPKLLARYDHIIRGRGYGVAPVIAGVCQGCRMKIPPQLNNILARFQTIEQCPRCQRLLYRQELLAEAMAPAPAEGAPPK